MARLSRELASSPAGQAGIEPLHAIPCRVAALCYEIGRACSLAHQLSATRLLDALGGLQQILASMPARELRPSDGEAIRYAVQGYAAVFGDFELDAGASPAHRELRQALERAAEAAAALGDAIKSR